MTSSRRRTLVILKINYHLLFLVFKVASFIKKSIIKKMPNSLTLVLNTSNLKLLFINRNAKAINQATLRSFPKFLSMNQAIKKSQRMLKGVIARKSKQYHLSLPKKIYMRNKRNHLFKVKCKAFKTMY